MSAAQVGADSTAPELDTEEYPGRHWLDGLAAWGASLLAHGLIALALASISWVIVTESQLDLVSEAPIAEPDELKYVIDPAISQFVGTNTPLKAAGAALAVAQKRGLEANPGELRHVEEELSPSLPMISNSISYDDPSSLLASDDGGVGDRGRRLSLRRVLPNQIAQDCCQLARNSSSF